MKTKRTKRIEAADRLRDSIVSLTKFRSTLKDLEEIKFWTAKLAKMEQELRNIEAKV